MKKIVLSAAIAVVGAGIAYAAKQGLLKPATDKMKPTLDKMMGIPFVAATVDKVRGLRRAANDDPMMNDQAEAA